MFVNKIAPFQFTKFSSTASVQNRQNNSQNYTALQSYPAPSAAHYLSMVNFTGGYSLDLEQTIEELEAYEKAHNEIVFPPSVREAAKEIIKDGDAYKWTLIDVHKDVFGLINTTGDLDTIKSVYPIFKDVVSADDVEARPGSLLDRAKNGELETFNPKNELSVDLIRLLYAEGLSTTEIKKHTDNVDVYHMAHKKLGIPLLHPHYAHILKLSDKDYNERLMKAIVATKQDNAERVKQSTEPVFIPKRKITGDETATVGGELEKHFVQNPADVYNQSENQHLFYQEHPEIAAKLTDLVLVTWGGEKHSSLTDKMKKHFKKTGVEIKIQDLDPFEITPKNAKILKEFWKNNPWALKAFSDKMKNLRAQEIPERTPKNANDGYLFKMAPSGLVVDFVAWKKEKGIFEQGFYNQFMEHDGSLKNDHKYKRTYELLSTFFKDKSNSSILCTTNVRTVQDLHDAIKNGELKDVEGVCNTIETFMHSVSGPRYDEEQGRVREFIKANEIGSLYQNIIMTLIKNGHKEGAKEALDFLYKKLDENYEISKKEVKATPRPQQVNTSRMFKTVPSGFVAGFEKWKKANNINQETIINPVLSEDGSFENTDGVLKTHKLIARYCDENIAVQNAMADVYSVTLLDLYDHITKNQPKGSGQKDVLAALAVLSIVREEVIKASFKERIDEDTGKMRKYITTGEAGEAYQKILRILIEAGKTDYLDILHKKLDQNYEKYSRAHGVK